MRATCVVVGEALIDVIREPDGTQARHPGGSPANVAFGLGRLGRPSVLLTQLGDDADGAAIRAHMGTADVDVLTPGPPLERTSTAVATMDVAGSARYDFDLTWSLAPVDSPGSPLVVHSGSLAAMIEPGATAVEQLLAAARGTSTVSYDPNVRPALMGPPGQVRQWVEWLVAMSDVVKVSGDDLAWLMPGVDPAEVAGDWLACGPALIVVTLGADGALAMNRDGTVKVAAPSVDVVDTVGAGDALTSGLLDGLWTAQLLGASSRERLRSSKTATIRRVVEHAVRAASISVTRAGASPPTRADL